MRIEDLMSGGSLLPITRWGQPVMHAPTRRVTAFGDELHQLIRDMFATMEAAHGVGLAATQVGRDLAVFILDCARWVCQRSRNGYTRCGRFRVHREPPSKLHHTRAQFASRMRAEH